MSQYPNRSFPNFLNSSRLYSNPAARNSQESSNSFSGRNTSEPNWPKRGSDQAFLNQLESSYPNKNAANAPIFPDDSRSPSLSGSSNRSKNINADLYAQALAAKSNLGLMDNRTSSPALEALRSYGSLTRVSQTTDQVSKNQKFSSHSEAPRSNFHHSSTPLNQMQYSPTVLPDKLPPNENSVSNTSDASNASPYVGVKPLIDLNLQSIDDEDEFLYGDSNDDPVVTSTSNTVKSPESCHIKNIGRSSWSDEDEDVTNLEKESFIYKNSKNISEMKIIDMKLNPSAWKDPSSWSDNASQKKSGFTEVHAMYGNEKRQTMEKNSEVISTSSTKQSLGNSEKSDSPLISVFSTDLESSFESSIKKSSVNSPTKGIPPTRQREFLEAMKSFGNDSRRSGVQYLESPYLLKNNLSLPKPSSSKESSNIVMTDIPLNNQQLSRFTEKKARTSPSNEALISEEYPKLQINVESGDKMSNKRTVRVKKSYDNVLLTDVKSLSPSPLEKHSGENKEIRHVSQAKGDNIKPKFSNSSSLNSTEESAVPRRYANTDAKKTVEDHLKGLRKSINKIQSRERSYSPSSKTIRLDSSSVEKKPRYSPPRHRSPEKHMRRKYRERSPKYPSRDHSTRYHSRGSPKRRSYERSPDHHSRRRSPRRRSRDRSPRRRSHSRHSRKRSRSKEYYGRHSGSRSPLPHWERSSYRFSYSEKKSKYSCESPTSDSTTTSPENSSENVSVISVSSSDNPLEKSSSTKDKNLNEVIKETPKTIMPPDVSEKKNISTLKKDNKSSIPEVISVHESSIKEAKDPGKSMSVNFNENLTGKEDDKVNEVVEIIKILQKQSWLEMVEGVQQASNQQKGSQDTFLRDVNVTTPSVPNLLPQQPLLQPFSQSELRNDTFRTIAPSAYASMESPFPFSPRFPPPNFSHPTPYNFPAPLQIPYTNFSPIDQPPQHLINSIKRTDRVCSLKSIPVVEDVSLSATNKNKESLNSNPIKSIHDSERQTNKPDLFAKTIKTTSITLPLKPVPTSTESSVSSRQSISLPVKTPGNNEKSTIQTEVKDEQEYKKKYKQYLYDKYILQKTLKNTSTDTSELRSLLADLEKKNSNNSEKQNILKCRSLIDKAQEELKTIIDNAKATSTHASSLVTKLKPEDVKKLQEEFDVQLAEGKIKPSLLSKDNIKYRCFDSGHHWCDLCCKEFTSVCQLLIHLYSKDHLKFVDPFNPVQWKEPKKEPLKKDDTMRHIKGVEFIKPHYSYYCQLCSMSLKNEHFAEQHLKSQDHFVNYLDFVKENPIYERKRDLIRNAKVSHIQKENYKKEIAKKQILLAKRRKLEADTDKKIKEKIQQEINREGPVTELEEESMDVSDLPKRSLDIKFTLSKSNDSKKESESKPKEKLIYIGQMPNFRSRSKFGEKTNSQQKIAKIVDVKSKFGEGSDKTKNVLVNEKLKSANEEKASTNSSVGNSKVTKSPVFGCQSETEAKLSNREKESHTASKISTSNNPKKQTDTPETKDDDPIINQAIKNILYGKKSPKKSNSSSKTDLTEKISKSTLSSTPSSTEPLTKNVKKTKSPEKLSEEEKDFLLLGISKADMIPLVVPRPPPPSLIQQHAEMKTKLPPFPPPLQIPPPLKIPPPDMKVPTAIPFPPPIQIPPPDVSTKPPNTFQTSHPPFPPPLQVPPPNVILSTSKISDSYTAVNTLVSDPTATVRMQTHSSFQDVVDMEIDNEFVKSEIKVYESNNNKSDSKYVKCMEPSLKNVQNPGIISEKISDEKAECLIKCPSSSVEPNAKQKSEQPVNFSNILSSDVKNMPYEVPIKEVTQDGSQIEDSFKVSTQNEMKFQEYKQSCTEALSYIMGVVSSIVIENNKKIEETGVNIPTSSEIKADSKISLNDPMEYGEQEARSTTVLTSDVKNIHVSEENLKKYEKELSSPCTEHILEEKRESPISDEGNIVETCKKETSVESKVEHSIDKSFESSSEYIAKIQTDSFISEDVSNSNVVIEGEKQDKQEYMVVKEIMCANSPEIIEMNSSVETSDNSLSLESIKLTTSNFHKNVIDPITCDEDLNVKISSVLSTSIDKAVVEKFIDHENIKNSCSYEVPFDKTIAEHDNIPTDNTESHSSENDCKSDQDSDYQLKDTASSTYQDLVSESEKIVSESVKGKHFVQQKLQDTGSNPTPVDQISEGEAILLESSKVEHQKLQDTNLNPMLIDQNGKANDDSVLPSLENSNFVQIGNMSQDATAGKEENVQVPEPEKSDFNHSSVNQRSTIIPSAALPSIENSDSLEMQVTHTSKNLSAEPELFKEEKKFPNSSVCDFKSTSTEQNNDSVTNIRDREDTVETLPSNVPSLEKFDFEDFNMEAVSEDPPTLSQIQWTQKNEMGESQISENENVMEDRENIITIDSTDEDSNTDEYDTEA